MAVVYTQNVPPSTVVPALNVSTYATRSLYVTPAEFKAAPTGMDVSQLIPGGTPAQQAAALVMQLQRASGVADKICRKILGATLDTQAGYYRIQQDPGLGQVIKVPLDFTPIVAVAGVSMGSTPSNLSTVTDLTNIWISKKTVVVPVGGSGPSSMGPLFASYSGKRFATVQYVNGWANTTLYTAAKAGDVSVTLTNVLGVMPGQQLNLVNTNNSEIVTVSPSYIPSNTATNVPVPLVSPVVGAYSAGDTATNMPQEIKQAVILIAKSLIKTRGSESIVLASVSSQPDHVNGVESGVTSDMEMAEFLLSDYVRAA